MPGLGYGGHGQHFVDYGHYEEFEDLGAGPAEYGDVSLSFRGLPMVFVFAAAFVATGYYLLLKRDAARQEKDTARRLAEREARRRAHEATLEDPLRPTTAQLFQRRTQRSLSLTDAKLVAVKLEEKRIPERRRRHTDNAIDLPALDPETTPFVKTSVEFVREERQRHAAWEAEKLGLVTGADERVRALMRSDELRKRAVDGWRPAAAAKFEGELEEALKPEAPAAPPPAARPRRHTYDAGLPPLASAKERARRAGRIEAALRRVAGSAAPRRPAPIATVREARMQDDLDVLGAYLHSPTVRCR